MNQARCVLCGERNATTKEHVPPRSIFPKPRPSDLITVPACFNCNNDSSQTDESFKVHLGMHVWNDEPAMRTLDHNSKLKAEIISKIKPVQVLDANDQVVGEVHLSLWDRNAHSVTIEKCVKGLYFHHFGEILSSQARIKTHYFQSLTPELIKTSENWASNSVGNDDFVYKYTSASNGSQKMSIWIFEFFGAHWAGGQTLMNVEENDV